MTVNAEEGYAVVQEEGACYEERQCDISGDVRYASSPYVLSWEPALVLAGPGQIAEDVLPVSVNARYILNGENHVGHLPVIWEIGRYESYQEKRLRFRMTGEAPGGCWSGNPGLHCGL